MAGSILQSSKTRGISVSQFLESFQRTWSESRLSVTGRRKTKCSIPRRLGLAVSGGADSMALAYLCKQLERSNLIDGLKVTAFVVDHKARDESSREARTVAGWLDGIGIKSQILELDWSNNAPSKVSAFETHARRLRFQAIGKACRDAHIQALLMGHHQDDNVETTLWRLSSGARGAGLAGIPSLARIPECHGLYGVAQSGMSVGLRAKEERSLLSNVRIDNKGELQMMDTTPPSTSTSTSEENWKEPRISTGGILICRPLLSFPKIDLLATCHDNQIPYVSDPTNFDPTLTPRNAIRSLLSSNRLPQALRGPSILSLIKSSQNLLNRSDDLSNELLRQCNLLNFNPNSGTLVIEFPSQSPASTSTSTSTPIKTVEIQALTLRRITELISPHPEHHFSLRSFEPFTQRLFSRDQVSKQQPFTLGGVMFQPLHWKAPTTTNTTTATNDNSNTNAWLLTRQPFMRHRLPVHRIQLPLPRPSSNKSPETPIYTPWTLWDDRYWFRFTVVPQDGYSSNQGLNGRQSVPLVLHPLKQSDLQKIRQDIKASQGSADQHDNLLSQLTEMLSREAPGQARFTVPALTMDTSENVESLLSLPTMDFHFTSRSDLQGWKVKWEWMYKMIDSEPLELMGWLEEKM